MNDIPDIYYHGAAADYPDDCPYPWYELYNRCWWMAGFYDAQRGFV